MRTPAILFCLVACASAATFEGKKSQWKGYDRVDFTCAGQRAWVVAPKKAAEGRPWIWRARFFGHQPQADIALLEKGFHLAYVDVGGLFGAPAAVSERAGVSRIFQDRMQRGE